MADDLDLDFKESAILFLKGVHLKDYLGIEDRIVEKTSVFPTKVSKIYDDIPGRFTTWEEWPEATNLKCWHCDFIPQKFPVFIPKMIEGYVNNIKSMTPFGNFCNFSCAAGYILSLYRAFETTTVY
jgi:hypothetical protein